MQLESANADYFIFDLQNAASPLFFEAAHLISASNEAVQLLQHDPIAVVDPMKLERSALDTALDGLLETVRTHFSHRQIILLHTVLPEFFMTKTHPRLNDNFPPSAAKQSWFNRLEQTVIQRTHCHFIDLSKFYFAQKEVGRPLTDGLLEPYYYLDLKEKIDEIVRTGTFHAERPNFAYSLDRYIAD
ncbi:MAG: hypothetical protein PHS97_01815 [Oscillospiraceae bacterium]|nr:hypothetical protein [Oscillospiraceae bacterium]